MSPSVRVFRWALIALTAVLAVVLVVRGNVLVGVLVGAITVTRVVLLAQFQRRRKIFREQMQQRERMQRRGGFGPPPQ